MVCGMLSCADIVEVMAILEYVQNGSKLVFFPAAVLFEYTIVGILWGDLVQSF
jgi:hypothetical protein